MCCVVLSVTCAINLFYISYIVNKQFSSIPTSNQDVCVVAIILGCKLVYILQWIH